MADPDISSKTGALRARFHYTFLALLLLILILPSIRAINWYDTNLNDGLLAYYKMDSSVGELDWANGNNLLETGSVPSVAGKINNSRGNFSSSDYLRNITWNETLLMNETISFSFSYWMNVTKYQNYHIPLTFSRYDSLTGNYLIMIYISSPSGINFQMCRLGTGCPAALSSGWSNNTWLMVTATYSGSDKNMSLYVNGDYQSSNTFIYSNINPPYIFSIGQQPQDNDFPAIAELMDEIGVWNRVLNETDIQDLWNGGSGLEYVPVIPPPVETCLICNQTCSPCGYGCNATDLSYMFQSVLNFDSVVGDITGWDTSCITSMREMFEGSDFNQSIGGWDTSSVTNMESMFNGDFYFNQNLNSWDTSQVTEMSALFKGCTEFNGDISAWDTSQVTNMGFMFTYDQNFNQDIGGWDTSSVTNMESMFAICWNFNQDIGGWDVGNVQSMRDMFRDNFALDQDFSAWDTSSVTNMENMFITAINFKGDISAWDISSLYYAYGMFIDDTINTTIYDSLLNGWGSQISQYNVKFHGGYSQYSCDNIGRANLINNYGWLIIDGGSVIPLNYSANWSCTDFGSCDPLNISSCLDVIDINLCNLTFAGNLSDYDADCVYVYVPKIEMNSLEKSSLLFILVFFWLALLTLTLIFRQFILGSLMFGVGLWLGYMIFLYTPIGAVFFILFDTITFMIIGGIGKN